MSACRQGRRAGGLGRENAGDDRALPQSRIDRHLAAVQFDEAPRKRKSNPEAAVRVFWKQYPDRAPKDRNDPKALATDLAIIKAQMVDMGVDQLPIDFAWGSQQAAIFEKIEDYLVNAGQISSPIAPTGLFTNAFATQYNQFDHSIIINQARNWK